jgi:hypothetical protein
MTLVPTPAWVQPSSHAASLHVFLAALSQDVREHAT